MTECVEKPKMSAEDHTFAQFTTISPPPPPPAGYWTPGVAPVQPLYVPPESAGLGGTYLKICIATVGLLLVGVGAWYFLAPQKQWDPLLEPYVDFVEQTRGYEFERPVDVRVENIAAALGQEALDGDVAPVDTWSPWTEAYRLLGLYDPNVDLAAARLETTQANAAAYYDPIDQVIVLPSDEIDVWLAETIVHELTHALQDQHGLIVNTFETPDSWTMRLALIEGDANRVTRAWVAQLPAEQQDEYWSLVDDSPEVDSSGDDFLAASFALPYILGEPTVELIMANEGVDALDELMRRPSLGSSERLVDPLSSTPSSTVSFDRRVAKPDGTVGNDGNLGPVVWFQALAPLVGTDEALDAVVGFDADGFVAYAGPGTSTCVRFVLWFNESSDAGEFVDTAVSIGLAAQHVGEEVTIDQCDAVGDPTRQSSDVLVPLMYSSYLAGWHVSEGLENDVARCAAFGQAKTMPLEYDEYPLWDDVVALSASFVADCA